MKRLRLMLILTFYLLISLSSIQGQNIINLLKVLPDSALIDRKINIQLAIDSYISKSNEGINSLDEKWSFAIDTIDIRNGFLQFQSHAIGGQREIFGEICYWNKTNGEKLIALKKVYNGSWAISVTELELYVYTKNGLLVKKTINEIIPDFDLIKDEFISYAVNLCKEDSKKIKTAYKELEVYYSIKLPQKGKNIMLGLSDISVLNEESFFHGVFRDYKPQIQEFEYKWKDGIFILEK